MIKTIATDLDGTLFYPKKRFRLLSSKNKKFLKKFLQDKTNDLVLVSGRNFFIAKKVEKKLKTENISMIACNGAALYCNGKIIYENPIPKTEVKYLFERLKNDRSIKLIVFMTNRNDMLIVNVSCSSFILNVARIVMAFQGVYKEEYSLGEDKLLSALEDKNTEFYKIMPVYGWTRKSDVIAKNSIDQLSDEIRAKFEIMWSGTSLEFMKKQVNKANALKKYLNMLKLEEVQTAVVGDSGNDFPLFEEFEQSFCMSHSPKEIQAKAKYTIEGVYEVEKYI